MSHAALSSSASELVPEYAQVSATAASAASTAVTNRDFKIDTVKLQLDEILSVLKAQQSPGRTTVDPSGEPPVPPQ